MVTKVLCVKTSQKLNLVRRVDAQSRRSTEICFYSGESQGQFSLFQFCHSFLVIKVFLCLLNYYATYVVCPMQ